MFEGKIALVTGGTSGIGKEIVKQLLSNGAFVFVNYGSNEENRRQAEKEFQAMSSNYQCIQADVSNEIEVKNMMFSICKEKKSWILL